MTSKTISVAEPIGRVAPQKEARYSLAGVISMPAIPSGKRVKEIQYSF